MSAFTGSEDVVFAFGPFELDRDRRFLARDGAAINITPKAFDLLVALVERGGAVMSKDELMSVLWPDTNVEESNLAFQISTLRKALGPEGGRFIATLPGRGYQFVGPLQRIESTAIVEAEDRTTITVSEGDRPAAWMWVLTLALILAGTVAATLLLRKETPSPPVISSLAVLPFKPLVGSERDEALELGMADTLITRLSRVSGVTVRSISSVRGYTSLGADPLAAGKALGVDAVVDGSIQWRGSRMRVTVRLLRVSDGKPVWATRFDADAHDLFAVQDVVAERVASALGDSTAPQVTKRPTADLEAYNLYLKGRYWALRDPARAEEFFRRALMRDPRFAAAWAGIAESWLMRGRYRNASPREPFEKARKAAIAAVALDPELAEAHAALGQVHADHDWDWDAAEKEFRRALELNPSSDVSHVQLGHLLAIRGNFDGALEHLGRAAEIDPVSPMWAIIQGWVLDCAGRNDEAIRHLEETLRLHPGLVPVLLHLGIIYTNAGQPDLGIATLDQALAIEPGSTQLLSLQAYAHARAGRVEQSRAILHDVERSESPPSHNLALAWTALGDHDRAFSWLDRAYSERLFLLRVVVVQPGYAPLRSDPRFAELRKKIGL